MADPLADYYAGQINMPSAYTGAMENLGFQGTPFGGVQQSYADVENFQRSLKRILDQQMQAFGQNNINALPANLRGVYSAAAPVMTDPMWGIIGAPGMFSQGYQYGDLPQNHTTGYQQYIDRLTAPPPTPLAAPITASVPGASNVPPPLATPQANQYNNNGQGNPATANKQFIVQLPSGGQMTVNAQNMASALNNVPGATNARLGAHEQY